MNESSPERWARLWRQVGGESDGLPLYQELVALYSQPHRHYHNLQHINECLAEFDSAHAQAKQTVAVELAIWFHDAIYDPRASDNEEKSAALAVQKISDTGAPELAQPVAALIMATKLHEAGSHPDAPLLVDVDLSILGIPKSRFEEYETQIRREYDWVPAAIFASKRAEILQRFLTRPRIYKTESFFTKYEQQARTNIQHSLRKLV